MSDPDRLTIGALDKSHDRSGFDCSIKALNGYLHRQAGQEQRKRVAFPFVLTCASNPTQVLGFYTLSASAVLLDDLPPDWGRKLPHYPYMPVTLLGRLGVDQKAHSQGLGKILLMDALERACRVNSVASVAVVTDPKDQKAADFYRRYGFEPLVGETGRLCLQMRTIAQLLSL